MLKNVTLIQVAQDEVLKQDMARNLARLASYVPEVEMPIAS
jgi:hypothetical protein